MQREAFANRDSLPDAELLRCFHDEGDQAALSVLVERHRALAYRVALGVLRNAEDAQDATQNAFLSLLAVDPRRYTTDSLAGLVARLALRSAQRLGRGNSRRQAREWAAAGPEATGRDEVFSEVADHALSRSVRRAVQSLADSYRLPVQLHYLEGLSTRETAEALGISQTAVTTRLSRAIGRLRRHLAEEGSYLTLAALMALLEENPVSAAPVPRVLASRLQEWAAAARPAPVVAGSASAVAGIGLSHAKLAGVCLAVVAAVGGIGARQHLASSATSRAAAGRPAEARRVGGSDAPVSGSSTPDLPTRRVAAEDDDPQPGARPQRPEVARGSSRTGSVAARKRLEHRAKGRRNESHSGRATPPRSHRAEPTRLLPTGAVASGTRVAAAVETGVRGEPEPLPKRLTAAEQRAVAAEILVDAWRETEKVEYSGRYNLLVALAMCDPDEAEKLGETAPAGMRQHAQERVAVGLMNYDPPRALRLIDRIPATVGLLLHAVRYLSPPVRSSEMWRRAPVDEAKARELLRRATEKPNTLDRPWRVAYHIADAAGFARKLRDPSAKDLTAQAIALAPGAVEDCLRMWRGDRPVDDQALDVVRRGRAVETIASHLAHADMDAALALVEQITDEAAKVRAGIHVAMEAAAQDPARARALVESLRPTSPPLGPAGSAWCDWAGRFAGALAGTDPDGALALARSIPFASERARALALVARALPADQAAPVSREALAAVRGTGNLWWWMDGAGIAEAAPVGPERRDACMALLDAVACDAEGGPVYAEPIAAAAFALAPADPEGARAILEELLASLPPGPAGDDGRRAVAVAFAPLDPRRGAEIARTIPVANPDRRFGALAYIANYLVTSPEERRPVRFDFWLRGYYVSEDTFTW